MMKIQNINCYRRIEVVVGTKNWLFNRKEIIHRSSSFPYHKRCFDNHLLIDFMLDRRGHSNVFCGWRKLILHYKYAKI